jgi:hypothetical protein
VRPDLVRAIATAHDATITAHPMPDGGLIVSATFPLPASPAAPRNTIPEATDTASRSDWLHPDSPPRDSSYGSTIEFNVTAALPASYSLWRSGHVAERPYLAVMQPSTPNSFSSAHENIQR